jgi:hypothetical protein
MRSVLFWDITQRQVVVFYRRLGTNNPNHQQGGRITGKKSLLGLLDP